MITYLGKSCRAIEKKEGKREIKKRIKVIIIFIIGMIIEGIISAYAATVINSSEVSYTSNGQSTIQGAIEDLYTLSNT